MNIIAADCGFDPALIERFEDITVEFIRNDNGVDYTIVCSNGASTKNQLIFPSASTLYSGDITPVNNMTVVYKFFTDGYSIYCDRKIYK